ncbi:MAG: glycogen synthase GlgA [Verrucomicrobiae bacterium]|nr:glycogen synthase GlgA [Verrucomicrobiae bacterium]
MRLLLASSEVHPYSKTGGLADMVGALAKSLADGGHDVGIVTPLYRGILEKHSGITPMDYDLAVPLGDTRVRAGVMVRELGPRLRIYFVDQREFFWRAGIYNEGGVDYPDNADRFIFFSKAVVHLARYLPLQPEIVHCHDWQAGLVPLFIKHALWREGWGSAPGTVLTIHNLAYQGVFGRAAYPLTNLPWDYFHPEGAEAHHQLNCLKAAISFSDRITTVSPRYAREIMTEAFGCGLDGVLRRRRDVLTGILNGVDTDEWDPARNPSLKHHYSAEDLSGKAEGKLDLQRELGLVVSPDVPLFGTITRLADQKGVDILLAALEEMLAAPMQFVLLGSGDPQLQAAYERLAARYPRKVAARIGFNAGLAHRIEAGCDFYLMPSRFEPCGLNQMYSLIYGTIPIVRRTGGLDDSVVDARDDMESANGIKFNEANGPALARAIRKALVLYADGDLLHRYRLNAMHRDFSWAPTRAAYLEVFEKARRG